MTPTPPSRPAVRVPGRVAITELSGSESVAHFDLGALTWVSLSAGIHPYSVGEMHDFHMVPDQCFYFGPDGALRRARGCLMARITLEKLRHAYGPKPTRREDYALKEIDLDMGRTGPRRPCSVRRDAESPRCSTSFRAC